MAIEISYRLFVNTIRYKYRTKPTSNTRGEMKKLIDIRSENFKKKKKKNDTITQCNKDAE